MTKTPTHRAHKGSLYRHAKRKAAMKRPEQILQIAIFDFLRPLMIYQKYSQFMAYHVPNGGWRTKAEAGIFKAMGQMPGVADMILMFPEKYLPDPPPLRSVTLLPRRTVYVELKPKGRVQTEQQRLFQDRVRAFGFEYEVLAASDTSDAVNQIQAILSRNGVRF